MLEFATISGLWVSAGVLVVGGYALWRGQHRGRAVSSVRLWRGLEGGQGGRLRRVDPLWLMVLGGTLLAGLALAGPAWHTGTSKGLDVIWAVRDVAAREGMGRHVGGWVRVTRGILPEGAKVRIDAEGKPREWLITAAQAKAGMGFDVSEGLLPARVKVVLVDASGRPLAGASWESVTMPFGWLMISGAHGVDPALERFFRVHPAGRAGDPTVTPLVVLVSDPKADLQELLERADVALIVVEPGVMPPGVTPGSDRENGAEGWKVERGTGLPDSVRLERVRVRSYQSARLSPDWEVLATAGGEPWIARRHMAGGPEVVWLASQPVEASDWASDSSFVVFWGEMVDRTLRHANQRGAGPWRQVSAEETPREAMVRDLRGSFGAAAMGVLVVAAWGLWRRTRPQAFAVHRNWR